MDNEDDDGCRRFMVNPISKHTSTTMSEEIHVPVISLDDDDDLKIDKGYKLFLDHLRDENKLGFLFEDDNGESETRNRKFDMFLSGHSERSKLGNEKKPTNNRVSQQRKRKTIGFEAEISRAARLVTTRESIQRDNRLAQRRKRKIAELDRNQETIQRDNKAMKMSVSKVETLTRAVPLVRAQESIQGDNKGRKIADLKAETLRKEAIQRDNRIAERRKKKRNDETKAAETSRAIPVVRVNRVTELKAVDETSEFVPVTQSNKGVFVGTRKKNEEESVAVVDKDYMSYLTWLVDSLKDSTMANLENDPPIPDTQKESTVVPEKDLLVKVKDELDLESWSDDDDIIAVSDSPFSDGEGTPFVASKSKNVIDVDKESREDESSSNCWFKKLMDVLEKPYDEEELLMLSGRASMKKPVIQWRELRKGRERSYKTDELGQSYLESFTDFNDEYQRVDGDGKARLELLRGFFFYLENISQEGAFQPWLPENKKKLWIKKQCLQP